MCNKLQCRKTGSSLLEQTQFQLSWVHSADENPPSLISVGQFVFSPDSRLSVALEPALGDWLLAIERVR